MPFFPNKQHQIHVKHLGHHGVCQACIQQKYTSNTLDTKEFSRRAANKNTASTLGISSDCGETSFSSGVVGIHRMRCASPGQASQDACGIPHFRRKQNNSFFFQILIKKNMSRIDSSTDGSTDGSTDDGNDYQNDIAPCRADEKSMTQRLHCNKRMTLKTMRYSCLLYTSPSPRDS